MTKIPNLFEPLDIEIWDFIGIWCLEFEISEYLNTPEQFNDVFIGYSTIKFHIMVSYPFLNPWLNVAS